MHKCTSHLITFTTANKRTNKSTSTLLSLRNNQSSISFFNTMRNVINKPITHTNYASTTHQEYDAYVFSTQYDKIRSQPLSCFIYCSCDGDTVINIWTRLVQGQFAPKSSLKSLLTCTVAQNSTHSKTAFSQKWHIFGPLMIKKF